MHILSQYLIKILKFQVSGVCGKAQKISSKNEQGGWKKQRNEDLKIAEPSWRVANRPGDRFLFQCVKP